MTSSSKNLKEYQYQPSYSRIWSMTLLEALGTPPTKATDIYRF